MGLVPTGFGGAGWNGGAFTGTALAPNGTNAAPAYAFSSDASTGVWTNGANDLFLGISGVTQVQVSSTQFITKGAQLTRNGSVGAPGYAFENDADTGWFSPANNADRLVGVAGGVAWFEVNTSGVSLSMLTQANGSGMTTGQLRLTFAASGVSLLYSSGRTLYVIGQSSQSVAQP